jgi:hypothetical protein
MRIKQDWMNLSQPEIDILPEWMWGHYSSGGCVCHASGKDECVCGAWWRVDKIKINIHFSGDEDV